MHRTYSAIYQDKFGKERTKIQLDDNGHQMKILLRGVEFSGASFNQLSPNEHQTDFENFLLDADHHLHSFRLDCEISVSVFDQEKIIEGLLRINCKVDSPENGGEDDDLKLELSFNEIVVQSDGSDSSMEDELISLGSKLPRGSYIKTCSNCRFSDYNPYVNSGLMGELVCFVNSSDKENTNRGKGYPGWRQADPVLVQEIFLCPAFEPKPTFGGWS